MAKMFLEMMLWEATGLFIYPCHQESKKWIELSSEYTAAEIFSASYKAQSKSTVIRTSIDIEATAVHCMD